MFEYITEIDFAVLNYIAGHIRCAFLDCVMPVITLLGENGVVPILLALVLMAMPKTRKLGISMGIAFALGGIVGNLVLKNVVARIRPYDINTAVELLIPPLSDFSFPSGHTMICFETAAVLLKKGKHPYGLVALALAALVAFSRLYLYVHYPSDVLVGAVLGILLGVLGYFITDYVSKKLAERKAQP